MIEIIIIIEAVSECMGITTEELQGRSRVGATARARQLCMYCGWQFTPLTLAEIGEELGYRTPATISNGYSTTVKKLPRDKELREALEIVADTLKIKGVYTSQVEVSCAG